MGSLLKALGATIWGFVAIGLLAIFIFVGYEFAMKLRATSVTTGMAATDLPISRAGEPSAAPAALTRKNPPAKTAPFTAATTRQLLRTAASNNQYAAAIDYGQQLVDEQAAEPQDLSLLAKSYLSAANCTSAQYWAQKATQAFNAASQPADDVLSQVSACCRPRQQAISTPMDTAQRARLNQFLSGTEAGRSSSGELLVKLGEVYYGFAEYNEAIAAIELGLARGGIKHLDEAYVYLGRSEAALGHLDEARNAFNSLKDVPSISPRVLRLWTLYAEVRLAPGSTNTTPEAVACATTTGPGSP